MIILILFATFLLLFLSSLFYNFYSSHQYWERRGISGPEGTTFLGNFFRLSDNQNPRGFILYQWTKIYGKVYGIYEGTIPVLVVSDLEMLQDMFVRKFDCFYARKLTNLIHGNLESSIEEPKINLFSSRGTRWKRLRSLTSSVFTVKILRTVHTTIEDSALTMIDFLEQNDDGRPFNIHRYFQEYSYDVISRLAMGQPHSEIFQNWGVDVVSNIFLRSHRCLPWYLAVMFPEYAFFVKKWFYKHEVIRGGDAGIIHQFCETAVLNRIKERKENARMGIENTNNDFIDMFLDYCVDSIPDTEFGSPIDRKMTTEDVVGSCFLFLLAGFDTTANTLAYTSYLLAKNPIVMTKLQNEIDSCISDNRIDYDELHKMKYLDAVIKEALRLYPVAHFACARECMKTTKLGDMVIEKGVMVEPDIMAIHMSKEVWGENAEEFVPERWFDEKTRHAMAWLPFGAGARQCVGIRLGMEETKVVLCHILKRFHLVTGPETEDKLNILGCTTTSPEKVTLYLKTRSYL